MTISYPLNDALTISSPQPSRMELRPIPFGAHTTSPYSGDVQAVRHAAVGRWGISLAFPRMVRANADQWIPLFNAMYGSFGSLLMPIYKRDSIRGSGAGTPVVDGADQTGTSLNLRGMTASATGVFLQGDLINIGTDLFEIVRDVDADGSGEGIAEIWPGLRSSPADGAAILTSSIVGHFRQRPDFEFVVTTFTDGTYQFGWEGVEA